MSLLTEQQAQQVSDAIDKVEQTTDAELVTVLAYQADSYHYIPTLWAALLALLSPGVVMFTPFWINVKEVIVVQLAVFLVMAVILRLPPVMRRIIPRGVKQWRASNLARRQFLENNLHCTEGETGVLIFVAETERYVEIIADRGISKHVPDEHWQDIVDQFTSSVKTGRTLEGFITAVERCGILLSEHVPATRQKNELSNRMVII
ncbi:MAG TPA: TPM domain-containing protein [Pseudomonadales bacterium]|nr:TPM domain-containing protein [Pseudomonadales bacterium]